MEKQFEFALLHPDCTEEEVRNTCNQALEMEAEAVCVPPYFVAYATELLAESKLKVSTVVGYPMGYSATAAKVEEIKRALDDEVDEINAVVNLCAIKNDNWNYVSNDINSMTRAVHLKGKKIAIVIEANSLDDEHLQMTCELCKKNEVNQVMIRAGKDGQSIKLEELQTIRHQLPDSIALKLYDKRHVLGDFGSIPEGLINRMLLKPMA